MGTVQVRGHKKVCCFCEIQPLSLKRYFLSCHKTLMYSILKRLTLTNFSSVQSALTEERTFRGPCPTTQRAFLHIPCLILHFPVIHLVLLRG